MDEISQYYRVPWSAMVEIPDPWYSKGQLECQTLYIDQEHRFLAYIDWELVAYYDDKTLQIVYHVKVDDSCDGGLWRHEEHELLKERNSDFVW